MTPLLLARPEEAARVAIYRAIRPGAYTAGAVPTILPTMDQGLMNDQRLFRLRLVVTGVVTLSVWALLAWDHFHGGVPRHYLLHDPGMPAISNWWGGVLLPAMTWFLAGRIHRRVQDPEGENGLAKTYPVAVIVGFVGSVLFGALLSILFNTDHETVLSYMVMSLPLLALLFPIYRAEYVLGFVLGMTFTFGAVLPTGFAVLVALVGLVLYQFVRPVLLHIGRWAAGKGAAHGA